MTLGEFIIKWTGKPVDVDGIYPNQCMDLMHKYKQEVLGLDDLSVLRASSAYLAYTSFQKAWEKYFEKINNLPTNKPNVGDIIFWGTSIGANGHVAIVTKAENLMNFESFDANWPTGSLPHLQGHDYNGVLGWLRWKAGNNLKTVKELTALLSEAVAAKRWE